MRPAPDRPPGRHDATDQEHHRRPVGPQRRHVGQGGARIRHADRNHVQGRLHPSLERIAPGPYAKRVQRQGVVNAWDDPNFARAVAGTGRKQLIVAAVTTDICLVFPTISAVEAGYEVQAVLDASGSSFAIGEETSRRRMERAGVWLTSTNTMVAELV